MSEPSNPPSTGVNASAASGRGSAVRAGDSIDKFQLVELLATGGTSVVWKGYDKLLDRTVAVKQILLDSEQDTAVRDRFAAEMELHKKLAREDKHLVRVLQFVDEPRGLFIVMEHVDGQTLEQLLTADGKPLDVVQALGIVAGVAVALKTLHSHDVLHRDLKPANILLPSGGGLKLCDFGLAAALGEQQALSMGSVRYMAPELFQDEPVDAKADIYSLGMIAYEMLAGRQGFNDAFKAVLRDQRNQSLRWMKWHTNPRAAAPPLKQINPVVNDTLSDLVERMMHKDPAMRIGSTEELLGAIRRHFAGGQEPAVAPSATHAASAAAPGDPTAPLPKRKRLPYILAAILAAQVLILAGVWAIDANRKSGAVREQKLAARTAYDQAMDHYRQDRFDEARSGFQGVIDQWSDLEPRLAAGSRARLLLTEGRQKLAADQADQALALFNQAAELNVLNADEVNALVREASTRAGFTSEIRRIEQLLEQGKVAEARRALKEQRTYTLRPDEEKVLAELGARVEDQASQREISRISQEIDALLREGKRNQAITRLNEAVARHGGSGNFRQRLDELNRQVNYEKLMADAQRLENGGEPAKAVEAYAQAQKIKSQPSLEPQMNRLRARMAYEEGQAAEQAGNRAAAQAAYTRALGYGEHPQATAAVNRLKVTDQRTSFVRAGDDAAAAGEFAAAANHYQNAIKLGAGDAVAQKLRDVTLRATLARVKQLMDQGELAAAQQALEPTLDQAEQNSQVRELRDQLQQRQTYAKFMQAGDNLRGRSRFGDAKLDYLRARKIMDTPEVRQRLAETEYDHLIAQARDYMEARKWSSARGVLRAAAEIRSSELVQELLAKVQQEDPIDEQDPQRNR